MSKIRDENYFQVSGWMLNNLNLKGTMLEVYAIIYGFSQDGESYFTGSLQYLSDFTNTSKPTVIKALKELVEKGFLVKQEIEMNGVKFNKYKADLLVVKNLNGGSKETLPPSKESLTGGSKETLPNNKDINNINILNNNIKYIVEYLNQKAKTNYKPTTQKTIDCIKARFNENFTVEDFKVVIDKKCAEWMGTDMEKFLRPETLFGNKFEGYLNAKIIQKKPQKQNGFNNFKGRNYGDMQAFERMLLESQTRPQMVDDDPEWKAERDELVKTLKEAY